MDFPYDYFAPVFFLLVGGFCGYFAFDLRGKWFDVRKDTKAKRYTFKPENVPKHIGVIMDGNRRFGRQKHSDPLQGHWAGGQTLVDFIQWSMEDGVEIVTVYAFSSENWKRDPHEINTLMTIFAKYADTFKTEALSRNVRVKVLSTDFSRLSHQVQQSVRELEAATEKCNGFLFNICLSYGGRADIVSACQSLVRDSMDRNSDSCSFGVGDVAALITEENISRNLSTREIPDPEIMIRTSGEYRLSNFLLWQLAYTELFFIDKFWPELTQDDLRHVLFQFQDRQRRFGH